MARQFPGKLVPQPTLEHTPARTMASRHQLELKYLTLLRSALRKGASPDLRWDELGLTHNMVVEALEAHPDDLNEAVQVLATRVRTQATSDYNKLAWTSIPDGFRKRWVARHDPNTRHAHLELDGTTIKKWSPFRSGPYLLQYPGDPTAPPELTYNCRCVVVPVVPPSLTAGGYNPAQLRIPKGNEELSGRWMDSPFTLVKKVMDAFPQEVDRPRPKGELPERPPLGGWVDRSDRFFARLSLFSTSRRSGTITRDDSPQTKRGQWTSIGAMLTLRSTTTSGEQTSTSLTDAPTGAPLRSMRSHSLRRLKSTEPSSTPTMSSRGGRSALR